MPDRPRSYTDQAIPRDRRMPIQRIPFPAVEPVPMGPTTATWIDYASDSTSTTEWLITASDRTAAPSKENLYHRLLLQALALITHGPYSHLLDYDRKGCDICARLARIKQEANIP